MSDADLAALAEAAGLERFWQDSQGRDQKVPPETQRRVLEALGLPAGSPQQIAQSRNHLRERAHKMPPLVTAEVGRPVYVPSGTRGEIRFEHGGCADLALAPDSGGGMHFVAPVEPGYHTLEIDGRTQTLAVAPTQCWRIADASPGRRLAGLAVQLYSLRGGHTRGFGDFAALGSFAEKAAVGGVDAIAVSPVHALFTADPGRFSPYAPSSRLFLNPLYADSVLAGGVPEPDDGKRGLIDWPAESAHKLAVLRHTYDTLSGKEVLHADFESFCASGGEVLRHYAIFETLDAYFRARTVTHWQDWPAAYRRPDSDVVAAFARGAAEEVRFHLFLQWAAARSAADAHHRSRRAGMAVGIIADIAVGLDRAGAHAWSRPDDVMARLSIGAPPDPFNYAGQDWGLTGLDPIALVRQGFRPFIAMLRASMRHAGGVRIDHAMGVRHLWVLPAGAAPTEGAYLRYPEDDLLRLVALESMRARCIVIGEDLGTVPPGFQDRLAATGITGMRVLLFQREWDGRFRMPERWDNYAVAMSTTHDLPTLAGWWSERDLDWQRKIAHAGIGDEAGARAARPAERARLWAACRDAGCAAGDAPPPDRPEAAIAAALCVVGKTRAPLALATAEDLLAEREQPNLPGTIDEHPNWRRRLAPGDPFADSGVRTRLAALTAARGRR